MNNKIIRVLLVDDHSVVRTGFKALLNNAPNISVVSEAETGEQACQNYVLDDPDVVVMDLSMPGIGGLEAIRRIHLRDPAASILVFSMHDDTAFVDKALQAGAKGYISKNNNPEVLLEAVETISRGDTYLDHKLAQSLALQKARGHQDIFSCLTTREFEIFCLLAQGKTAQDTASDLAISYKTVANYTTQIKAKLKVKTGTELAHLAMRHGVITPPSPE